MQIGVAVAFERLDDYLWEEKLMSANSNQIFLLVLSPRLLNLSRSQIVVIVIFPIQLNILGINQNIDNFMF